MLDGTQDALELRVALFVEDEYRMDFKVYYYRRTKSAIFK